MNKRLSLALSSCWGL